MPLFKNKKETQKQQSTEIKKAKGRRAKTAQQSIPYEEMYPNGMIKVGPGLYSKSYYFGDMNFATEKEDKQEEILKSYSKLLSKYAPNVTAQFTVFNRKASTDKIKEKFFLKPRNGSSFGKAEEEIEREKRQQEYRDEYNSILDNRIKEGRNDIQKERYISYLPNGLIVGQSGRGKSFFAKGEIIPNLLDTDDDFIIMDPDGEYVAMANEFGGTVINVSQRSETHINPLDMDINYAASKNDDPVAMKADYLVSLCESATKQVGGLTPYEINTIQKVTKIIYKDYLTNLEEMRKNNPNITIDTDSSPTLASFYSALLDMDGPEAHQLAMAMERFCVGNDDVFAHRTNINPKSRLIVYNLKPMPKNMKEFGMMVCLSDIWNRIVRNKDEHKNKATWVYLDEFYLMVQTESSAIMLQEYFKRCRKYHGIMTGITQDIEDLLITPEGRGIFNNSGFVAMLSQSNIGRSEIQEQLTQNRISVWQKSGKYWNSTQKLPEIFM